MPYLSVTVLIDSDTGAEPNQIFEYRARVFVNQSQLLNLQKATDTAVGGLVSTAAEVATTVTITTATNHGLVVGQIAQIDGIIPSGYNGRWTIATVPTPTTF